MPAKHGKTGVRKAGGPGGAPTFLESVAEEICERVAQGVALAAVCREAGMPSRQTVHRWREEDAVFAARFARAREDGFDSIAHRLREIARGTGESSGDLPRDKLIIDTDLKLLSKWAPKRYGDKVDVGGKVGGEIKIILGGDVG